MTKYELMPTSNTYALGVEELRKISQKPLTFKEVIQARVDSYNTGDKSLFESWIDSCTGIAYKKGTTKFKIKMKCDELINIDKDFNNDFLPIGYNKFKADKEFDSSEKDIAKRVWLFLLGMELYQAYNKIMEKENINSFPHFYRKDNTVQDELLALFVDYLDYSSSAGGGNFLFSGGSFLLVVQSSESSELLELREFKRRVMEAVK